MKKEFMYFLCPLTFILLMGCGGGSAVRDNRQSTSEQDVVKRVFWEWREHILNNRWEKAYDLTSQATKSTYDSNYEIWKLNHETNEVKDFLKNIVEVKEVGIGDDNMATIAVETSDKVRILWTAAKELGRWKIERFVPPR